MRKYLNNNFKKPRVLLGGNKVIDRMNEHHQPLMLWGISHLDFTNIKSILDVGCGGGQNILNISKLKDDFSFSAIDHSSLSVKRTKKHNKHLVKKNKLSVIQASVENLPYKDNTFDLVTAFETTYFWPDVVKGFSEIKRVLNEDGIFLVCNEASNPKRHIEIQEQIGMRIYTAEETNEMLKKAGFSNIQLIKHEEGKDWICAISRK